MKKLIMITLIMLLAISLVLVSCSNNPNEEKKEETAKEQDISETELKALGTKYSSISTSFASLAAAVDKDSENYKEERTLTVTSTSNESFKLLTDDEVKKYNNEDDGTTRALTEGESSSTESETIAATEYKSLSWSVSYKNVEDTDGNCTLNRSGLVLTITPAEDEAATKYSDEEGGTAIADSSAMKEYQALLKLYKSTSDSSDVLSFSKDSEAMTKFISIVKEYAPEFNVSITFGTKEQGKLEADVVLSITDDGKILVNVKKASVSVSKKNIFTTDNAVFKVTPGDDFNLNFNLKSSTDGSSLYISFTDMAISGSVTVDFEDVTVKTPYDDKNYFEFVMKGSVSYNFTSEETKADVLLSDKAKIDISGISQYLPSGVTLPSLGVTVGFSYEGKFTLPKSVEEINFDYFDSFIKNIKITKFMIGELPITTDSMNKLLQDNSREIYDYIGKILTEAAKKASEEEKKEAEGE